MTSLFKKCNLIHLLLSVTVLSKTLKGIFLLQCRSLNASVFILLSFVRIARIIKRYYLVKHFNDI